MTAEVNDILYLVEGIQVDYLPKEVVEEIGW
jgi:hypothetical protein